MPLDILSTKVDNILMYSSFSETFSSKTKSEVLYVLSAHQEPMHFRLIAKTTSVSLHAVERALKDLSKRKIVVKSRRGNRVYYSLNDQHESAELVREVSTAARRHFVRSRAKALSLRAPYVLDFVSSTKELFDEVRRLNPSL